MNTTRNLHPSPHRHISSSLDWSTARCRAVRAQADAASKAYLVGTGPGCSSLLTLRAVELIKQADVLLYDDLGTEAAIQEYARPGIERVYVGKRGGRSSMKQEQIDELLTSHCTQGRQVVRLKGGCPSVFSRVSSELRALRDAGVEVEMVPGVSSSLAGPLLAGFPLTDTQLGKSFAVVSAHDPVSINWAAMRAAVDTLVLLMVGRTLPQVVTSMCEAGWDGDTPVAIIHRAGLPDQQVFRSRLGCLLRAVEGRELSPAVMVAGQVVQLMGKEDKGGGDPA